MHDESETLREYIEILQEFNQEAYEELKHEKQKRETAEEKNIELKLELETLSKKLDNLNYENTDMLHDIGELEETVSLLHRELEARNRKIKTLKILLISNKIMLPV